jgi:hypothetical protein
MARGWRQRNASPQSYSTFPTEEWENGDGEIVVDLTSRCPYSSEPIRSRGRKVGTLHTIGNLGGDDKQSQENDVSVSVM